MTQTLKFDSPEAMLSERSCVIVGAGASFDSHGTFEGVPLTRDLINFQFVDAAVIEACRKLLDLARIPCESIEHALGPRLDITMDQLRGLTAHADPAIARQAAAVLRDLTRQMAQSVSVGQRYALLDENGNHRGGQHSRNYAWLVATSCFLPKSSIINMNYDCLLDWEFNTVRQVPEFPRSAQQETWKRALRALFARQPFSLDGVESAYVKLHGSLYMYSCQNFDCPQYRVPFAKPGEWEDGAPHYIAIALSDVKCPACGAQAVDLILSPGRNKTKAEGEYFRLMSSIAAHCLRQCDTWMFIGYACPEYDMDILELFREAAMHKPEGADKRLILVVSPDAMEVRQRLERHVVGPVMEAGVVDTLVGALPIGFTKLVSGSRYL